jgi:hydroxymethylpyrimidine/phosphomethylpyrimidine kinase
MPRIYKALTIAGSDSGGGAGIQADLKTFTMLEVYGMSAITAITAQNTLGVHAIHDVPLEIIEQQIEAVVTDIGVDAVKTGMLSQTAVIELVAEQVKKHRISNLIVDPVMIAKGGAALLAEDAKEAIRRVLLPLSKVVTPNIPEAEVLTGIQINTIEEMKQAARIIVDEFGSGSVVVKGGHLTGESTDVLYDGQEFYLYSAPRFNTMHTHGTGCTFSAALAAQLAKGLSLHDAVQISKDFITAAIQDELGIGGGHGPTNHWAYARLHGGN